MDKLSAYKLADAIEKPFMDVYRSEVVTMLRQQADRIAELEKISSKPVAWMRKETDEEGEFLVFLEEEPSWCEAIPLYTHPVKQLSDEEIEAIYEKVYGEGHNNLVVALARAIIKEITE